MTPQTLIARHKIMNVLANHSRGVDRADPCLLADAYHKDAQVEYGFYAGPAATFVDILAGAMKAAPATLHRTSNCEIRVSGDRAASESYVIAYVEELETQRIIFGRYLDQHAYRNGEWRLTHRTYVLDGNINRPSTLTRADPPSGNTHFVPQGAKGAADPGRTLIAYHEASNRDLQDAHLMTPDETALDTALSRDSIRLLLTGYCRGVDRGDRALLASVFWDDSTVISGLVNASGPVFADGIIDYVTANLDYCFHSIANEWIEVKGEHGVGEHYILAHMSTGGQDIMTGGRYIDSYQRRHGVWKIKSRTFVADWNSSHPKSMDLDGMYEPLKTRGSFGTSDPIYKHWAKL